VATLKKRSIFDLPPLETGGVASRQGLAFQDHVATGFCLRMLDDPRLSEVWCETQDDITLLWHLKGDLVVEFVQAKGTALDQLWSVSELCARKDHKEGTSIVERSLAYDRCAEKAVFRIVTTRPFKTNLNVLSLPRNSELRRAARTEIEKLQQEFERRVGTYKSPKGITCREWAERVLLDARHNEAAVNDANLCLLRTLLEKRHFAALQNQVEEIYFRLVAEVFEAGRADPLLTPDKKRFTRDRFEGLLHKIAETYLRRPLPSGGKLLQRKLEDAGLPADTIQQAQEQRRAYRHRSLTPKYQETKDQLSVEEEVSAILHSLKSKLDTGALPDDGALFHAECLRALEAFQRSIPLGKRPPLADLQGAMYVSTDRCFHRYRRVKA
jgi:hypothetical protein